MTRCQDNAGSGTQEYVKIAQSMCEDSGTAVRYAVGVTEGFNLEVDLQQGSALSIWLFWLQRLLCLQTILCNVTKLRNMKDRSWRAGYMHWREEECNYIRKKDGNL